MELLPLTPERRRQQTREHLLAAAAEVFAERGFHGASLDEVAAVAGFTKGAVYSNFKNKEDLFLALFKANYDREMDALRATLTDSEAPPEARISDFVGLIRDQTRRIGQQLQPALSGVLALCGTQPGRSRTAHTNRRRGSKGSRRDPANRE